MTRVILLAAALICLVPACCLAQAPSASIVQADNGLTMILQEDHSADLVAVDVWVKAGSANETEKNSGVSHFIEHLAFGATAKRKAGQMDLEMESLGATLDAHTSQDWAHYATTVSPRYLSKALEVLGDAITHAQFEQAGVDAERPVLLEEIIKKLTNPIAMCRTQLQSLLYGTHPYSRPTEGVPNSVGEISREVILDYYHKHYVPGNIAVVLVGDFDPQRVTGEVNKAFADLPKAPPPNVPAPPIALIAKQTIKTVKAPLKLNYVAIGFLGPAAADTKDVCATDALLTYLGFGYHSWMSDELKDKMGLASEVSVEFLTQKQPGMISLVAAVSGADVSKTRDAIFAKLADVRKLGIPEGNLALAKRSLLGQFAFQNETYAGRANSLGFYFAIADPQFAGKYIDCVQSVTNDDVIRAAQKYFDPDHAVVLLMGPDQAEAKQ